MIHICFSWRGTAIIIYDLRFDFPFFLEKAEFSEMCFWFPHVIKNKYWNYIDTQRVYIRFEPRYTTGT